MRRVIPSVFDTYNTRRIRSWKYGSVRLHVVTVVTKHRTEGPDVDEIRRRNQKPLCLLIVSLVMCLDGLKLSTVENR